MKNMALRVSVIICIVLCMSFSFTRAEDIKKEGEYIVGKEDVLEISVLQPEKITSDVVVAPDGTITFAYIGSVTVEGLGLSEIQQEVQTRLSDGYMKYPIVSVSLKRSRSKKFFIYGEIVKPGTYQLIDQVTVLRAISMAGGLTKFGSTGRVKILRQNKEESGYETIKINFKAIMAGSSEDDILIEPGDMIVVSEGVF